MMLMREYRREVAPSEERPLYLALDVRASEKCHLMQRYRDLLEPLHFELVLEIIEIQTIGNENIANILISLKFFKCQFIFILPLVVEL
jgi:hypothetical protein